MAPRGYDNPVSSEANASGSMQLQVNHAAGVGAHEITGAPAAFLDVDAAERGRRAGLGMDERTFNQAGVRIQIVAELFH